MPKKSIKKIIIENSQEEESKTVTPKTAKTKKSLKNIAIAFICIVVFWLLVILYFSLSHATIVLTPTKKNVSATAEVNIGTENDFANKKIAGHLISTVVEDTRSFNTTGTANATPELNSKATGTATIANNSNRSQPLVATTRLLSSKGILYRTTEMVVVPAGAKRDVGIIADKEGDKYLLTNGDKMTIPGLSTVLQKSIYGVIAGDTSLASASGKVLTDEDVANAEKSLTTDLTATARQEITKQLKEGETVNRAFTTKVLEKNTKTKIGEGAGKFNYHVKLEAVAVIFKESDLLELTKQELANRYLADKNSLIYRLDSFDYSLKDYNTANSTATISSTLEGEMSGQKLLNIDKSKICNMKTVDVQKYFSSWDQVKSVEVRLSPFWVTRVPWMKDHIEIVVEE